MPGRGKNSRRGMPRGPTRQSATRGLFFGKSSRLPADPPTINARPWVNATVILSRTFGVGETWGFTISDLLDGLARQFGVNNASTFNLRLLSVKLWAAGSAGNPIDISAAFINPVLTTTDPPLLVLQDSGTATQPAKASFHYGDILAQRYITSTGNGARQFLRLTVDQTCDVDVHVAMMWSYYNINPITPARIRSERGESSRPKQVRPMNVKVPVCDEEAPYDYDELQPLHYSGNSPPARNGLVRGPSFEQMLDTLQFLDIGSE